MHMTSLDNTQAYNVFVFIIIEESTLNYIWTCVIWDCNKKKPLIA